MPSTKIVFLILPNIHLLDLAGADQVFFESKDHGVEIEIEYCTFTDKLKTSTQLSLSEIKHFDEVSFQKNDFLVIPGADISYLLSEEFSSQNTLFEWLKMTYQKQVIVCSVCTGAFVLGLAGLLDEKKCTTHWKRTSQLQKQFPKAEVVENILFVEDKNIISSAGVTAGIDLALHIVSRLKDEMTSYKVARELVIYLRRSGNQAQQSEFLKYRNHIHKGIHKVQDWLQENIHQKTSLPDLAELACMSTRNLTRIFKKETGISVNEFTTIIRKEKIKILIKNPDITKPQLAKYCGLTSERQVFRLLNK